ncbi:hypothetical protein HID58_066438 [Brassica napus]|uniref:Uncharacterized protein n=1 Tax=Brassica napus TaxID=3708 RepID=A0ABQ7ZFN0_BRANA|nr:hypothetical protein HID58_066438 [Brassica napus]
MGTSGIRPAPVKSSFSILLLALLLCRLSPAFVLFSSLALNVSLVRSSWSPITFLGFDGLSSRMVSSAGYVASSDVIVGSGGWFPGPLKRRGGVLPILLKSGDRFDGLFDTEMSCGPLYAGEYGPRFSFWLVKGYGGRCWVSILVNTGGFHCMSWVPDLLFLKISKRSLESKGSVWWRVQSFIDREAYEFRQIHREPITLEVTPEVPTSEARR